MRLAHRPINALAWLLPCAVLTLAASRGDESTEPPVRYYLEHQGRQTNVRLDQPFELETAEGRTVRATLRAHPTRIFSIDQLSFEYPRHMPFEYDDSGSVPMWTLDGDDVTLIVQRFGFDLDPQELLTSVADSAISALGDGTITPISLTVQGEVMPGHRVDAEVAGHHLRQDYYLLARDPGNLVLLIFQDSPRDDGSPSDEAETVRDLITRTLKRKA